MNLPPAVKTVKWIHCATALALACAAPGAGARELKVPEYKGNPGRTVTVPVVLDDAAGVAGVKARVNFDPNVVTVAGVKPGGLGSAFDLGYEVGDQGLLLSLARTEALAAGTARSTAFRLEGQPLCCPRRLSSAFAITAPGRPAPPRAWRDSRCAVRAACLQLSQ
jgi:hypothetical protein